MKQLLTGLILTLSLVSTGAMGAENNSPYIQCYRSIVEDLSKLKGNSVLSCASKTKTCYLLSSTRTKSFQLPAAPTHSLTAVKVPETDTLQDIDVYPVAWGATPGEKVEIHFYKQMGGYFVKPASDPKSKNFSRVTLTEVEKPVALDHFRKVIEGNVELMKENIKNQSRPQGWTEAQYKENCRARLRGCAKIPATEAVITSMHELYHVCSETK